jgi:hypothetical protein
VSVEKGEGREREGREEKAQGQEINIPFIELRSKTLNRKKISGAGDIQEVVRTLLCLGQGTTRGRWIGEGGRRRQRKRRKKEGEGGRRRKKEGEGGRRGKTRKKEGEGGRQEKEKRRQGEGEKEGGIFFQD